MNNYQIEDVLPHDHPMIFLDELCAYDKDGASCRVTITATSHFYDANTQSVPVYVGIEYMAQCIAAYANANELDNGNTVSVGFLVSSRKFETTTPEFALGTQLLVTVEKIMENDNGLSVFECSITHAQDLLAKASINVFQPEDPAAFLAEQF